MAKQTKRARKFSAKGGVQARLEKGTITNKGKLRSKRKRSSANEGPTAKKHHLNTHDAQEQQKRRQENDFVGESNLAGMDLDTFFETFAEKLEAEDFSDENDDDGSSISGEDVDDEDEHKLVSGEDDSDKKVAEKEEDKQTEESGSSDSDDDEKEDDEDVDAATERMKREMDKLQKSDPEFHKFLSEHERSLLEFGEEEQNDELDDDVEADEVETEEPDASRAFTLVDVEFLRKMEQGAFKSHGIKSLKKLTAAYKAACHLSDANQDEGGSKKYHIESSAAFDELMVMCLTRCQEEFEHHLVGKDEAIDDDDVGEHGKEGEPISSKILLRSPHWNEIKPIFQSFIRSTLNMLSQAKEPEQLTFILKALSKYVRFLTPFPRLAEAMLKSLVALWSAPLDSSEDYQVVRLNAFIRIRQLALTQPFPFIETCLKKTYLAYANRAKFATSASVTSLLPTLTFMGNCVVELYSLDYHSSYQHAFVYIRQLALHLRTAIQKKTPEALQNVYCWQYIHCLKLWVAVITASCKKENDSENGGGNDDEIKLLRSLIYPLVQVILGVVRLVPTTRHLPLRLHCVRFLQQLAATAECFIPTTSILLEVLDAKEIGMKPKKVQGRGGSRGLQLALILKLPKDSPLRTHEQLEACVSEVFLLLNREVELYRYSAGFPEFSVAICQRLRKFSKETRNSRWRAYSKGCIDLCERYSTSAVKERSLLNEAPKDVKRLEVLKPSSAPSMGERHDAAIAKEKPLEEVTRPATKKSEDAKVEIAKKESKVSSKATKNKKKAVDRKGGLENVQAALGQADEVAEGIDWSDEDSSGDDDDSGPSESE